MLKVKEIMTSEVVTLAPEMEVTKAAGVLLNRSINGAPVVDQEGRLIGILCQSDLITQQKEIPLPSFFTVLDGLVPLTSKRSLDSQIEKIAAVTVRQAMSPGPVTVSPDTEIQKVAELMVDKGFHTLPVVDGGRLVGIVGKADVLKTLLK